MTAILLSSVFVPVSAKSKPFNSKGDHRLIAVVKFDSDCWDEIYARATPKNNNHVLLNKQTITNNDEPDSGPSEVLKLKWNIKGATIKQTSSTNEGKIRYYVEIELVDGSNGETLTQYKTFNAKNHDLTFDTFNMKTDPTLCDSLVEISH